MTTPDIAGLCERLREEARKLRTQKERGPAFHFPWGQNIIDANNAAADAFDASANTLKRQADEINRLRLALVEAGMRIETCPGAYKSHVEIIVQKIRSALTGEDTATLSLSGKTQTKGDACTS
jgi:hypothetical protein